MIDWQRVETLRSEMGEEDFADLLSLFLQEVDEMVETLLAGCDPGEHATRLRTLKGSALNLGFDALAALCREDERTAATRPLAAPELRRLARVHAESRWHIFDGLWGWFSAGRGPERPRAAPSDLHEWRRGGSPCLATGRAAFPEER